jgi:hypothetical protein
MASVPFTVPGDKPAGTVYVADVRFHDDGGIVGPVRCSTRFRTT